MWWCCFVLKYTLCPWFISSLTHTAQSSRVISGTLQKASQVLSSSVWLPVLLVSDRDAEMPWVCFSLNLEKVLLLVLGALVLGHCSGGDTVWLWLSWHPVGPGLPLFLSHCPTWGHMDPSDCNSSQPPAHSLHAGLGSPSGRLVLMGTDCGRGVMPAQHHPWALQSFLRYTFCSVISLQILCLVDIIVPSKTLLTYIILKKCWQ